MRHLGDPVIYHQKWDADSWLYFTPAEQVLFRGSDRLTGG
jgi:hypothetical protein